MPRPPRIHVPDGFYHVTLRGNHQQALFATPEDRDILNDIVAEAIERFDIRVHAFCWMTNHLHLLIQISDLPLGRSMKYIETRYARYRHEIMQVRGHLFEKRYAAKVLDKDSYFQELLRYIHMNPVKAKMVADPADYPWLSHRAYLGTERIPWLTTDFGLATFSIDPGRASACYEEFMRKGKDIDLKAVIKCSTDSRVLGSAAFTARIAPSPQAPERAADPARSPTLEAVAEKLCAEDQIDLEFFRSRARCRYLTASRVKFAYRAVKAGAGTLADIARFLRRDPSALAHLLARYPAPPD